MKIYTRTGDQGETSLFGGGRVRKDEGRVEAYGAVDELNSFMGSALVELERAGIMDVADRLRHLQSDLFSIGGSLATPGQTAGSRAAAHLPPLPLARVQEMEAWIDAAEEETEPLREFILPGGTEAAARLHIARTVCRKAERRVITLAGSSDVDPAIVPYLNRLSDLLFTFARLANARAGVADLKWRMERDQEPG